MHTISLYPLATIDIELKERGIYATKQFNYFKNSIRWDIFFITSYIKCDMACSLVSIILYVFVTLPNQFQYSF